VDEDEAANAVRARLDEQRAPDDDVFSITSAHQRRTENACGALFDEKKVDVVARRMAKLYRSVHAGYLRKGLKSLPRGYQGLHASQPWLCYWILNSLDLLGLVPDGDCPEPEPVDPYLASGNVPVEGEILDALVSFLATCAGKAGGYGGGPLQLPHLAPTYAAVNALCVIGTEEAYDSIDREKVYAFLLSVKHPSGGFRMHDDGEVDIRASYCAVAVASVLNLLDDALAKDMDKYIASCQTYEGGMGGEPGNEAHGGYTFCGVAAAQLLGRMDAVNVDRLLSWVTARQLPFEGGFQGRTNKLVDSCYSFWQGAVLPILHGHLDTQLPPAAGEMDNGLSHFDEELEDAGWLFNQRALQDYILLCCQQLGGGLKDKPGKNADFYHTCYSLNGLSMAQSDPRSIRPVVGVPENCLNEIDPRFGVRFEKIEAAMTFFAGKPHPTAAAKSECCNK